MSLHVPEPVKVARPHLIRAAIGGAIAVVGLVVASFGQVRGELEVRLPIYIGATLMAAGGFSAVKALSSTIKKATEASTGDARGSSLAVITQGVGYGVVGLAILGVMGVPLQGLLLGSALTGVVLGLAAQQVLANFFAGIVLATLRQVVVGEQLLLKSGPLGGAYEGVITDMTLFNVKMMTEHGQVVFPNAGVLAATIGPGARSGSDLAEDGSDPS